jgi:hypothetical protein
MQDGGQVTPAGRPFAGSCVQAAAAAAAATVVATDSNRGVHMVPSETYGDREGDGVMLLAPAAGTVCMLQQHGQ